MKCLKFEKLVFFFSYQLVVQNVTSFSFKITFSVIFPSWSKIQIIQYSLPLIIFTRSFSPYTWETGESWQPFQEKQKEDPTNGQPRSFLESTRNTSHKFLRTLGSMLLISCPGSSARQSSAFWGCSVHIRQISPETTDTDTLRNRSGNLPEHWRKKPGTNWGSFSEWSPSWSGLLWLSVQQLTWVRPGRDFSPSLTFLEMGHKTRRTVYCKTGA